MKQQIAIYLRLSLEDVDKRTNAVKDDSNSIVAQRLLINRHLDQNPGLNKLPRLEFCDDGFSGTNFERPEFIRMIEYAKRGAISCIVVKDLSRFGRDYLEVGDYLEHIFPFLGIRFKAINDHYDSIKHEGKTIGMDIAFKNLIYDYYSKDLSKKVKSAMGMKQRDGKYVSCAPYGYLIDPTQKHQLIPDPETAPIVRRIFLDVIAGKSDTQIAKELNMEGIITPAQRKSAARGTTFPKPQWNHRTILNIVENIKYSGTMVNHTRESRHIRDKNQRRVPREEWYIRENAHESIVSQQEYNEALALIHRRKGGSRTTHDQSDRVFYCAHCGRKLEKQNGTVFACPSHRYQDGSACEQVRWRKKDLEEVILEALKAQLKITQVKTTRARTDVKKKSNSLYQRLITLKAQMDACDREKFSIYEAYRENELGTEEYLSQKSVLTAKQAALKEQLADCETQYEESLREQESVSQQQSEVAQMCGLSEDQLKQHLYDAVERVEIHDAGGIEIAWKFAAPKADINVNEGVTAD